VLCVPRLVEPWEYEDLHARQLGPLGYAQGTHSALLCTWAASKVFVPNCVELRAVACFQLGFIGLSRPVLWPTLT